ncbi:Retrovirus-related Pol polyprotein, partial [Operophtera brumata]
PSSATISDTEQERYTSESPARGLSIPQTPSRSATPASVQRVGLSLVFRLKVHTKAWLTTIAFGLKLRETEGMYKYITRITELSQQLREIDSPLDDEFVAIIMLSGLTNDYDPLIMALEKIKLTTEQVKSNTNLLSVSELTRKGYTVKFDSKQCKILGKSGNYVVATASYINGVYKLDTIGESEIVMSSSVEPQEVCRGRAEDKVTQEVWHKRLGHLNSRSMNLMKNEMVTGPTSCALCLFLVITRNKMSFVDLATLTMHRRHELESRTHIFNEKCERAIDGIKKLKMKANGFVSEINCEPSELKDRFLHVMQKLDEFMYMITDFNLAMAQIVQDNSVPTLPPSLNPFNLMDALTETRLATPHACLNLCPPHEPDREMRTKDGQRLIVFSSSSSAESVPGGKSEEIQGQNVVDTTTVASSEASE